MTSYSITQASNLASIIGIIGIVLSYFKIDITNEEIQSFVSAGLVIGGLIWSWWHRYQKGDLTLAGFRK